MEDDSMARTPENHRQGRERSRTLAEMLLYLPDPMKRKEFDEYRVEYEAIYGETDLTKRYTCTWPMDQQEWLIKNDMKRYFDGLPPFVKAYFKGKMQMAARDGRLDDKSDEMIKLFLSGQMKLDQDVRHR
jgi:hypothetical protein